jgi:hypothetical protein
LPTYISIGCATHLHFVRTHRLKKRGSVYTHAFLAFAKAGANRTTFEFTYNDIASVVGYSVFDIGEKMIFFLKF